MEEGADVLAETVALEEEGDESNGAGTVEEEEEEESKEEASMGDEEESCEDGSHGVPQEGVVAPVLVNVAEAAAFKLYRQLETVDPKLIMGNTEEERFADKYRLGQMSDFEREAELAKRHDALKAHQDMEKVQEHQRQLAQMRAAVDEQRKRREVEALRANNQVSFLVQFLCYFINTL
jgi:hypothetical protein